MYVCACVHTILMLCTQLIATWTLGSCFFVCVCIFMHGLCMHTAFSSMWMLCTQLIATWTHGCCMYVCVCICMHGMCVHTALCSMDALYSANSYLNSWFRAYTYKHTNTYKYTYLNRLAASGVSQFSFGVGCAAKAMILKPECMRRMPREESSFVVKPDLCVWCV